MTSNATALFSTSSIPLGQQRTLSVRHRADTFRFHSYHRRYSIDRKVGGELMASPEIPVPNPSRTSPQWQLDYELALRETDQKMLFKRVEIAEARAP